MIKRVDDNSGYRYSVPAVNTENNKFANLLTGYVFSGRTGLLFNQTVVFSHPVSHALCFYMASVYKEKAVNNLFKKGIVPVVIMLSTINNAIVQATPTDNTVKEYRIDPAQRFNVAEPVPLRERSPVSDLTQTTSNKISVTISQLKDYPDLVKPALLSSLLANNEKGVALLLPFFKQQEPDNLFYIHWGDAVIAHSDGKYSAAISLYQKVLAENPDAIAARLQLAVTLYENYNNKAARHEFATLMRYPAIPGELQILIEHYLNALTKRADWKFSASVNYLADNNVNNAPKRGTQLGFWTTASPESAKGAGYYARAKKKIQLTGNLYSATEIYGLGKYYITNHKYDDATLRVASGISYQNAKTEITLLPFFEQIWYAGGYSTRNTTLKRYAHSYGGRMEMNQLISDNWLISGAVEYGQQSYAKRAYLTGDNILVSAVMVYAPNIRRYWFVGSDFYQENAREKDNAYRRKSIRIGWNEKWAYGINTSVTGSYARRNYFEKDFFAIKRNNNEYSVQASIWLERLNFLGFTPVLVWAYRKNDSNHPFYRYEKNNIYLEIEHKLR